MCNSKVKLGLIHPECKDQTYLDGHFFVTSYNEGVKELIMKGKYSFNYSNFEFIGKLMSKFIKLYNLKPNSIIVPIPLTKKKRRIRGFNQSETITKQITTFISLNLLIKQSDGHSQAGLNGIDRRQNLKDLFIINPKITIEKTLPIILVDDVFTTGSTLSECAKTLKSAGFKTVYGYTFSKAGKI
ncbi:MAG: hypothetical protein ABIM99_02145 [Candidatus Dojkabacteria bacterium]